MLRMQCLLPEEGTIPSASNKRCCGHIVKVGYEGGSRNVKGTGHWVPLASARRHVNKST